MDARVQLFDLKTKYQFQTKPGYDKYNMPMYSLQQPANGQTIYYYPVYQGFMGPAYINGVPVRFETQKDYFFNNWINVVQQLNVVRTGDGGATYTFQLPIGLNNQTPVNTPMQYILRGHVDMQGIIALTNLAGYQVYVDPPVVTNVEAAITIPAAPVANVFPAVYITSNASDGSSIVVSDSGQFLAGNQNHGLLMAPGVNGNSNATLTGGYSTTSNTINYLTGEVNVVFPQNIPVGVNINVQCQWFQSGLPRSILFNNNTLTFRSPPDKQYMVEIDAYLSPAGFLATNQAIQFGYMCEYIARGAARKILSDTGDMDQFNFYEPLFQEQEMLVWKRAQRQFTATRTQTIYSQGPYNGNGNANGNFGGTI